MCDVMWNDRRLTIREMADDIGISYNCQAILTKDLRISHVCPSHSKTAGTKV